MSITTFSSPSTTILIDQLTLEINQADALIGLVADRLLTLTEHPDAPHEIYALSVVARAASDKINDILEKTIALHKAGGAA